MSRYIYDGFLPKDVTDSVRDMSRRYPFCVEVSAMPEHRRWEAVFADMSYTVHGEGCMGEPTSSTRKGVPYGFVHRDFMSDGVTEGFLFLPSEAVRQTMLAMFPELVVNPSPFKTLIGD